MLFMNQARLFNRGYFEEAGAEGAAGGGAPAAEPAPSAEPQPEPTPEPQGEPTPEPQPEPEGEPTPEPKTAEDLYEGSSFFDAATDIFTKAEINGQVIVDFYQQNDGEFAPEHIALMEERLGKAQAQMMMNGIVGEIQGQADAEAQIVTDIYESVGGQENFEQAAAWAASEQSGWDEQDRSDMNDMLNMGGNFSKWAAQLMMIGFTNAGGASAVPITNKPKLQEGAANKPQGIQPISFNDYRTAIQNAKSQGEADGIVKRANHTRSLGNANEFGWKYG